MMGHARGILSEMGLMTTVILELEYDSDGLAWGAH